MKHKEWILCWNLGGDVAVLPWPDTGNLSGLYERTSLSPFSSYRKATFEQRKAQCYIEAMHLIIRDGCDPWKVHEALLKVQEYRDGLAEDMPLLRTPTKERA